MILKSRYNFVFILPILWLMAAPAGAQEMSMDALSAEFRKETGKTWESATSEEKRDFIHGHEKTTAQGIPKKNVPNTRTSSDNGQGTWAVGGASNLKRTVNIEVREQFFQQYGKSWEAATSEEQETFLTKYKAEKEKEAARQTHERRKKLRAVEKAELQKQREKRAIEKEKQREESARLKEERALEKKKEAERKKLEEARKKIEKMRRESKRRHKN